MGRWVSGLDGESQDRKGEQQGQRQQIPFGEKATHIMPLSRQALEVLVILRKVSGDSEWVCE
jgi:hypothetical protein